MSEGVGSRQEPTPPSQIIACVEPDQDGQLQCAEARCRAVRVREFADHEHSATASGDTEREKVL